MFLRKKQSVSCGKKKHQFCDAGKIPHALRLKNILEEYGISEIVESVNGKRRLVADKVQCDLYDYLSGQEEYAQLFKGSYLSNYSWGENTLAELLGDHLYGSGE